MAPDSEAGRAPVLPMGGRIVGAARKPVKDAPPLPGERLESLAKSYRAVTGRLDSLSRVYPPRVTKEMIDVPALRADQLRDVTAVTAWVEALARRLPASPAEEFVASVAFDAEHGVHVPVVEVRARGVVQRATFGQDFFLSQDYRAIAALSEQLANLFEPGAYVSRGEQRQSVSSFREALAWLLAQARKGVDIQRYKGLGEMNPGQLWETTMDPQVRRMLRVTVDDAIAADQMFTTLMGDQVEPRREFIEANALSVVNLDV